MKEFCNNLMKLSPDLLYGIDYTPIALSLFLRENDFNSEIGYKVEDFTNYIFRFYCDLKNPREQHYSKMVNNIFHYQPKDFIEYSKKTLKYIAETTNLIKFFGDIFFINGSLSPESTNISLLKKVVKILVSKYIGNFNSEYCSQIGKDDIESVSIYKYGTRIFNRALELSNRCFICDEENLTKLQAIQLKKIPNYENYNYLILCLTHAEQYKSKHIIIKKNGYPYIDGKRIFQHLEIGIVKKIRKYLSD